MTRASSPHRKRSASVGAKRTTTTASEQNGNGTSPNGGGSSSNDWRLQPMHSSKPIELVWNAWRLAFIYLVWLASRAIFRAVSGASFMTLTLWVPLVLHLVCYWVVSGFFAWVDFAKTPEAVHQWKIQRRTHVDAWQYASGAAVVLINQFCFSLPLAIGTAWLMERNGVDIEVESMPDLFTSFKHLLCYAAIWEVMFYSSHRLLHYGPFYKYVHKRHHTFSATVSLAAEYAHPIEVRCQQSTVLKWRFGSPLHTVCVWKLDPIDVGSIADGQPSTVTLLCVVSMCWV